MFKKRKKYKPYVPPPVPEISPEEAGALEKKLRGQINMWGVYPRDSTVKQSTLNDGRPGINWQKRIIETFLPKRPVRNKRP